MSQLIPDAATGDDIDGARLTKRPRSSTIPSASDLGSCERSLEYWFEDGNIVLRVGSVLYRVYRGILSRHSSVFRDMFAMPQPVTPNKDLVIEGCTVVELAGDQCQDWENVFKVLYGITVGCKFDESQPNQLFLVSMIRLGRKYQFDELFNEAMSQIAAIFPKYLYQWVGVPGEVVRTGTLVFEILFVLLEIGNQTLLPTVYFCCACFFKMEKIFDVFRVQAKDDVSRFAALERILLGRAVISSDLTRWQLDWLDQLHTIPQRRGLCSISSPCHEKLFEACHENETFTTYPYFVLQPTALIIEAIWYGDVCNDCCELITTAHEEGRVAMWDKLPGYFGLPGWNDLKDE